MEIQLEPESCKRKDMLIMPAPFASTIPEEDSGYLSQSQCSSFNETRIVDSSASISGSQYTSKRLCSLLHEDGTCTPLNSMEPSDFSSLGCKFLEPQSKAFSQPSGLSSDVHQSTPITKRLCVDVHKEFDFVTPLPGPSRNTSSKSFSLVGQCHVDILTLLSQHSILPPLRQILSYLEPADLCQLRLVSLSWRKLLNNVPHVKVWQDFVRVRQQNKENSVLNAAKQGGSQDLLVTPVSTRGQLRDIHNFVLVPTKQSNHSPPVSPSKMHSSRYFKEGQKLKSGEKLRKCPKCAWPSRADNSKMGVRCTGRLCGFHFCMDCSGPFHDNTPCAKATPVTPTKSRNRGTKLNKKRLHRLLL